MDIKKTPQANIEDAKLLFVLMGLVSVLSFVYIGLQWTKSDIVVYDDVSSDVFVDEEIDDIVQTAEKITPPPPPPSVVSIPEILNVVENSVVTQTIEVNTEDDQNQIVDLSNMATETPVQQIEEEDDKVIFQIVEKMPEFPGGTPALFKFLSENIKYPALAQELGIQGRVICQFVVNRDGSIVDVEVVRSIDPNLDKEAVRVIQLMPKWSPGEQRGKPVRVKYVLPVVFKLE